MTGWSVGRDTSLARSTRLGCILAPLTSFALIKGNTAESNLKNVFHFTKQQSSNNWKLWFPTASAKSTFRMIRATEWYLVVSYGSWSAIIHGFSPYLWIFSLNMISALKSRKVFWYRSLSRVDRTPEYGAIAYFSSRPRHGHGLNKMLFCGTVRLRNFFTRFGTARHIGFARSKCWFSEHFLRCLSRGYHFTNKQPSSFSVLIRIR